MNAPRTAFVGLSIFRTMKQKPAPSFIVLEILKEARQRRLLRGMGRAHFA
jgi:hypothetical protein